MKIQNIAEFHVFDDITPLIYSFLTSSHSKNRIIKWDEDVIAEHDKERGTRQKIDEPATPYRYQSESDQSETESICSNSSKDSNLSGKFNLTSLSLQNNDYNDQDSSSHDIRRESQVDSTTEGHVDINRPAIRSNITKESRKLRKHKSITFHEPKESVNGNHDEHINNTTDGNKSNKTTSKQENPVNLMNDWSMLHAKLNYEQYLQENQSVMKEVSDSSEQQCIEKDSSHIDAMDIDHSVQLNSTDSLVSLNEDLNNAIEKPPHPDFISKRAAHYNEYKIIQAMKAKMESGELSDEEDE